MNYIIRGYDKAAGNKVNHLIENEPDLESAKAAFMALVPHGQVLSWQEYASRVSFSTPEPSQVPEVITYVPTRVLRAQAEQRALRANLRRVNAGMEPVYNNPGYRSCGCEDYPCCGH